MDTIPYFVEPSHCPACGQHLTPSGSFLYCLNRSCSAKSTGTVKVWVTKLGLLHWGDALINSLTSGDHPVVENLADLYDLTIETLAIHSSGLKFAKKCHAALHDNKHMKFETFISSVNIANLGISTATDLVQYGFADLESLLSASPLDLAKVPNIGEKTALNIHTDLSVRANELKNLLGKLVLSKPSVDQKLSGRSFCITGTTRTPRKALQKLVVDNGGIVKESVVSGLSYLITNEDLSSFTSDKAKKASKFGIPVIDEDKFLGMVS